MKRCLACQYCFKSETWDCPHCGQRPVAGNGVLCFLKAPPIGRDGFKPEYFARLARIEEGNFWFRARNQLIQWALRNYFPNAGSFFEVGCGTGFVLKGVRESQPHLHLAGREIFSDGLAFAKARLPGVDLYQMDARQIPFECEFDVIGAFDVLEHIAEDGDVLQQMFRATGPGGGVLMTVPQHRFLWSTIDEHSMHQRRYNRADLRRKVERAGFQIERITSFNSFTSATYDLVAYATKTDQHVQLWREFGISLALNKTLESILKLERIAITNGFSFPAGGSLLLIARKP